MYSITLQNPSDTIISSGDKLGYINFSSPNESDGGAAKAIVGSIYTQAEGAFGASSSPASIVFATSDTNASGVVNRLKISESGHVIPQSSGLHDLGSRSLPFRDSYIRSGVFNGAITTTAIKSPIILDTGSPLVLDLNKSNLFTGVMQQDKSVTLINLDEGQKFIIRLQQSGNGGDATWFNTVNWPGGLVPVLSSGTKTDVFGFICTSKINGSSGVFDGFIIGYEL